MESDSSRIRGDTKAGCGIVLLAVSFYYLARTHGDDPNRSRANRRLSNLAHGVRCCSLWTRTVRSRTARQSVPARIEPSGRNRPDEQPRRAHTRTVRRILYRRFDKWVYRGRSTAIDVPRRSYTDLSRARFRRSGCMARPRNSWSQPVRGRNPIDGEGRRSCRCRHHRGLFRCNLPLARAIDGAGFCIDGSSPDHAGDCRRPRHRCCRPLPLVTVGSGYDSGTVGAGFGRCRRRKRGR